MKPAIKKRWLAALRSGEYKQWKGELRSEDGKSFCCLGVLTDLYIKDHKSVKWNGFNIAGEETGTLPDRVVRWAGVGSNDPYVAVNKENFSERLSTVNDDMPGYGFKRIATLIEKQL